MPDTKLTNVEKIESGSRFQFIAITDSWKNQRRKRRQQAREHTDGKEETDSKDTEENPSKRIKIDESPEIDRVMQIINGIDSPPPLLHIEFSIQSMTLNEFKAIVDVKLTYLNGTSSLNGVYELLQYIQNKWTQ